MIEVEIKETSEDEQVTKYPYVGRSRETDRTVIFTEPHIGIELFPRPETNIGPFNEDAFTPVPEIIIKSKV